MEDTIPHGDALNPRTGCGRGPHWTSHGPLSLWAPPGTQWAPLSEPSTAMGNTVTQGSSPSPKLFERPRAEWGWLRGTGTKAPKALVLKAWLRPWTRACSLKPWWGACQGGGGRAVATSIHLQTQWTKLYGGHVMARGGEGQHRATLRPQSPRRAPLRGGLRPGSSTRMCRMRPR